MRESWNKTVEGTDSAALPGWAQFVHIGRVVPYRRLQNDFSTLLSKIRKPRKKQEGPARELTQAGLFHLVKSFEIAILSQKRIEIFFQLCFPKPVTRIQQIFLNIPYIGALK